MLITLLEHCSQDYIDITRDVTIAMYVCICSGMRRISFLTIHDLKLGKGNWYNHLLYGLFLWRATIANYYRYQICLLFTYMGVLVVKVLACNWKVAGSSPTECRLLSPMSILSSTLKMRRCSSPHPSEGM